jgi:hypothetical protein
MQLTWWTSNGNDFNVSGDVYSRGVKLTSDSSLKEDITPVDPVVSEPAFDQLAPVRYKWKAPEVDNPLAVSGKSPQAHGDPDRLNWGFLADNVKLIAEDAVYEDPETGMLSYDPIAILAITVTQLQQTKVTIARLEARLTARGM